ncbi:MAG: peroxiredoxin [Gammaproteobacteria bacterium]|nr:peroxiredoxin [Gammaproteobacteria bacterium]
MHRVMLGTRVRDFALPATGGRTFRLSECRGHNVVLYFYPRDNTPGCSQEAGDFRDQQARFRKLDTLILGVSRDGLASHERFRHKHGLKFELLADEDARLCRLFGVLRQKNMYGRKFMGIERSTFLIDSQGVLRKAWRKLRVTGHVADVLEAVKELASA